MPYTRNPQWITGYLPGTPDTSPSTQWIFEGSHESDEWTDEMIQPLLDLIIPTIEETRRKYGWDVTNYWHFTLAPFNVGSDHIPLLFFATRRNWRFNLMGESLEDLVEKVRANIERNK